MSFTQGRIIQWLKFLVLSCWHSAPSFASLLPNFPSLVIPLYTKVFHHFRKILTNSPSHIHSLFLHCVVQFLHLKSFSYFYFIFLLYSYLFLLLFLLLFGLWFSLNNFKMLELFIVQNSWITWTLSICNFWTHIYKYYEVFRCYMTFLNSSFGKVQNIAKDLNFSAGMLQRELLERIRLFKRILYVSVRLSPGWIIIK